MTVIDTGTSELLCTVDARVATVTLNKPHKKNALGDVLTPALRQLLLTLEPMQEVGCLLLTGAGDAFCAGGDVTEMGSDTTPPRSSAERVLALTRKQETLTGRLYHFAKPTVAALPGAAAGAGLSLALACDLRVAAESAILVTAFRNIGLSGDYGASWFLPRLIGLARAKALLYRSPRLDAAAAQQLGLIDEVYPDAQFRSAAYEYAQVLAQGPTTALSYMKQNLQQGLEQSLEASFAQEARHLIASGSSEEAAEAIAAFKAKRPPRFHR